MFSRTRAIATLALALSLPLAACDNGTDAEFGTVSILLTDAPGDEIHKAWVTITDIYLQAEDGEEDPEGSRVYLLEEGEETHELLSLAGHVADLVVEKKVPTGTYGQLRVIISGGCIVTGDDAVFASAGYDNPDCGPATGTLQMPSFAQTGAKVLLNGLQVDGGQKILLLDFDVADSYGQEAGMAGMWVMNPVIHTSEIGLSAGIDATLTLGDNVTLPSGFGFDKFTVTLAPWSDNGTVVVTPAQAFADDDADGTDVVEFDYLVPSAGPFEVTLNVPDGLTIGLDPDALLQSVNPASGETAVVEWVIQSAEETSS